MQSQSHLGPFLRASFISIMSDWSDPFSLYMLQNYRMIKQRDNKTKKLKKKYHKMVIFIIGVKIKIQIDTLRLFLFED